jgi:MFS family permease
MNSEEIHSNGMRIFVIIWIGQVLSLLGTAISNFGLTLWAWEETGQATALAMVGFFFMVPMVALNPVVGVLIDRYNRKLMMLISDLSAALVTLMILLLHQAGLLQIWHLYVAALVAGTGQAFQWPAYSAAITLMLDKKHYTRANSMLEMAGMASGVFAPMLAGALIGPLGLTGLLVLDLVSAGFAIGALLFVSIPSPRPSEAGHEAGQSFWKEALYGFRFILERPSLLGLQLIFMMGNLFHTIPISIFAPMILARTGNNELIFGSVQSAGAIGGLVGGLTLSAWGGFRRRVHGVLLGWIAVGIGTMGLGFSQALPWWVGFGFAMTFCTPLINASNQAIWQAKVAPDVQGRVFAARRLIAWLVTPLSRLVAGPLADQVFEPAMQENGALAMTFDGLVGRGEGAGLGLIFVLFGALTGLAGLSGYAFPAVRHAETRLPDHDAVGEDV